MGSLLKDARDLLEISPEIDPEKHKNPNQGDKTPTLNKPKKICFHIFDKDDPDKSCLSFAKHSSRYRDLSGTNMPRGSKKEDLHSAVHKSGGFTVKRHVSGAPDSGFMVSVNKSTKGDHHENNLRPHHLRNYMDKHKRELSKSNAYLGGWHDPESKTVYLDVSHHYDRMEDAVKAGRRANQLAVFDLKAGKSIYLQKKDSQEIPDFEVDSVKELVYKTTEYFKLT